MKVKFFYVSGQRGNMEILNTELNVFPRPSEYVIIDNARYKVQSVTWKLCGDDTSNNEVLIYVC